MIKANIDTENNSYQIETDCLVKSNFLTDLSFLVYKAIVKYSANEKDAEELFNCLLKSLKESYEEGFLDFFLDVEKKKG